MGRGSSPLTQTDITNAAVDAISTLNRLGLRACFIGGEAGSLFGVPRKPNVRSTAVCSSVCRGSKRVTDFCAGCGQDLDIFVLSRSYDQEDLKRTIVANNSKFYLLRAKTPGATYKVLWYRFPPVIPQPSSYSSYGNRIGGRNVVSSSTKFIKVDILLPGAMDIPIFHRSLITYERQGNYNLPCAPWKLVILLKLQGWSQRRASSVDHYLDKVPMDHDDLVSLLSIAQMRGIKILPLTEDDSYMPDDFVENARIRVREHLIAHPEHREDWKELGYDVDALLPLPKPKPKPKPRLQMPQADANDPSSRYILYRARTNPEQFGTGSQSPRTW